MLDPQTLGTLSQIANHLAVEPDVHATSSRYIGHLSKTILAPQEGNSVLLKLPTQPLAAVDADISPGPPKVLWSTETDSGFSKA